MWHDGHRVSIRTVIHEHWTRYITERSEGNRQRTETKSIIPLAFLQKAIHLVHLLRRGLRPTFRRNYRGNFLS